MAISRINKLCPSCQTRVHLTDVQYKSFLRTLSLVVPCPACGLAVAFSEMSEPDAPVAAPSGPPLPLLSNSPPMASAVPAAVPPPFSPIAAPPFARRDAGVGERSATISKDDFARIPRNSNPLLRPVPPRRTLGDRWDDLSNATQYLIVFATIVAIGGAIFGLVPSLGQPESASIVAEPVPEVVAAKPIATSKKAEVKKVVVPVAPKPIELPEPELVVPREVISE